MRAFQAPSSAGGEEAVAGLDELLARGWTYSAIRAQLDGRRWQRFGRAIPLHNAAPTPAPKHQLVLLNCGRHAVLTAFTAVQAFGLEGWERAETHVLVPGGTHVPSGFGLARRVHFVGTPLRHEMIGAAPGGACAAACRLDLPAGAAGLRHPRRGRAAAPRDRRPVRSGARQPAEAAPPPPPRGVHPRYRARQAGAQRDFVRICRRFGLPEPVRQAVRVEPDGRRRYLDAEWIRADGQRVAVEIDGALHLAPRRWWDDQLRQNELVIAGSLVLQFPTALLRAEPELVAGQVRRALLL